MTDKINYCKTCGGEIICNNCLMVGINKMNNDTWLAERMKKEKDEYE